MKLSSNATPCRLFAVVSGLTGFIVLSSFSLTPSLAQKLAVKPSASSKRSVPSSKSRRMAPPVVNWNSVRSLEAALKALPKEDEEEEREQREKIRTGKPARPGVPPPLIVEEKEENGADALGARYYHIRQRAYPNDTIDFSLYPAAIRQRDRLRPAQIGGGGNLPGDIQLFGGDPPRITTQKWEFLGPQNYQPPYQWGYGLGAMNGRVNEIAYDTNKAGTYYLASAGGGIWKTTDSGTTWATLSSAWPAIQSYSVAIDPTNSNNVYAGTGDLYYMPGFGVMVSKDGGQTWTQTGKAQFGNSMITKILVDPENPNIVMASPYQQGQPIYRSTNSGQTWTAATPADGNTFWFDLSYSLKDTTTGKRSYYAIGRTYDFGVSSWRANLYRSDDQGATWQKLTMPTPNQWMDRVDVAASATLPGVVYVMAAYGGSGTVWRSTNKGVSWTDISGPSTGALKKASWGQAWYDLYITTGTRVVGGVTREVVYAGLIDILELVYTGGGSDAWASINNAYSGNDLVHVDQHRLSVNASNPNQALSANDGGVYQLNYDGTTWTPTSMNASLGMTQFYNSAYHPTNPAYMIAGAQDNGTTMAENDLANWFGIGGGDGGYCAINQSNPDKLFVSSQFLNVGFWDGTQWFGISPSTGSDSKAFITPFILDPSDQGVLYAGTSYLYRWTESTKTWENRLGGQKLSSNGYIQAIAVAPSDKNRIYTASVDGQLWMSTNRGGSWKRIDSGVTSLPNRAYTSIAVHPTNPSSILVGLSGGGASHLWRCDNTALPDATRTWTDCGGTGAATLPDISLNAVALDIDDPLNTYYVGTDIGVFATSDGGQTWANATQPLGLPAVQVNDLKAVTGTRYLNAATFGRGIWRIKIPAPVSFSIALSNSIMKSPGQLTGQVSLKQAAGSKGQTVRLTSSLPNTVIVPITVTVPAGRTSVAFPITVNPFTQTVNVTLTAKSGTDTATVVLKLVK